MAKNKPKSNKFYTADGVLIKPGMVIFVKPSNDNGSIAHCEKVDRITEVGPVSAYTGTIFRSGLIIPEIVYSSSEAASKATVKSTLKESAKTVQKRH